MEVARFIQTSERQLESQQYAEYVLERLVMISQSVSGVRQQIEREQNSQSLVGQQNSIISLLDSLEELLDLLPQIASKWQKHIDDLEVHSITSRYHLQLQSSSQRGQQGTV